jgi:hypothetical protein
MNARRKSVKKSVHEMKTAEEIVAEIERRAKYYERLDTPDSENAVHVMFAMRLLNIWIEHDD